MGFGGIWTQRFQAHHGIKKDKLQFLKSQILLASRWSLLLRAHEFLQIHMQIHMCQYKTWRPLSFKNLNWQKLYWLCINNPKFGQIVTTSFHLEIFFFFSPLWMARSLVLIMCTFSLIIYFALFYIVSHNVPIM